MDVRLPDGTIIQNVPDGTTKADLAAKLKANGMSVPDEWMAQKPTTPDDWAASEMSTAGRLGAGIGRGLTATTRAVSSAIGATPLGQINRAIHSVLPDWIPGRAPAPEEAAATRQEYAQIDAPLLSTRAGKVGNFIGQAAAVSPTILIPGANTYAGAALIGGGTGAMTTEGDAGERAGGALFGALGGLAGKGVGDLIGSGVSRLANAYAGRQAAKQVANAGRDAAAAKAREAGLSIQPSEVRPGVVNSLLEGLSGKIKTGQALSAKNQPKLNEMARRELGLPKDTPITPEALNSVRQAAGQAYEAVSVTGQIKPTPAYDAALDSIVAPFKKAAQGFPGAKPNPIIAEIESLRSPEFDAGSAIAKIRELRGAADGAYASGNKEAGKAFKSAAGALEEAIDTHLQQIKAPPGMLDAFREARKLIAKTYSVERGLNAATGDVSASALAKQLAKGKPLSGELRTIAEVAQAFPKATQSLPQNYNALSPLDYAVGIGTGNPLWLAARPAARAAVLSGPYQSMAARPSQYGSNRLLDLINATANNNQLRSLLPGVAAVNSVPSDQ